MKKLTDVVDYLESLRLYRQENVIRWQTRDFMFKSNDSMHQLYTTQIVLILADMFEVNNESTLKAIKYASCHDYVESTEESLGDINYMVKEKYPEIKRIVKMQERLAMQNVPSFYKSMLDCEEDGVATTLVNLADSMEAMLYVRREIKFNKQIDEWVQVEKELVQRVTRLWSELAELTTSK